MFKIIKTGEPLEVRSINILVYGEPGSGKTSLVNTAEKPLTLDFDKGAHRSEFRKDVLIIEGWEQINDNLKELINVFNDYNTIILDTVDTLLDFIGAWIIDQEPRLARNKLQFYGKLKDEFTAFIGKLKTLGKDVIMVAHVKERDEGDLRIKRPAITGGSYDRVLQISDYVGYLFIKDNRRTLDFNPTDFWVGKNSAKFDPIIIPDFNINPNFFADLIIQMKSAINSQIEMQVETINLINELIDKLQMLDTLEDINELLVEYSNLKSGVKKQIWPHIQKRADELGFKFDKTKKKFVSVDRRLIQ